MARANSIFRTAASLRGGAALALAFLLIASSACRSGSAPAEAPPSATTANAVPRSTAALGGREAAGVAIALGGGPEQRMIGAAVEVEQPPEDQPEIQGPETHAVRGRALGVGHRETPEGSAVVGKVAEGQAEASGDDKKDDKKDEKKDEKEDKDYWADVAFGPDNFEEVRRFVKLHYIDDVVDEKRAFIEASNFALLSLKEHPLEILPEAFYELRHGHPDEEGRLDGKIMKLNPNDGFVLHEIPKDIDKKRPRLSDDDIRQLRLREKARHALLMRHWNRVAFGERDFTRLIAEAKKRASAEPKFREANLYIAAAQGYLFSLDPHSSLVSSKAWEESTRETEDASFDGIGAVLTHRDNQTIVESPIEGQPAVRAGLRAGDVILKVDDKDVDGMPLFKVVKRIRGPKGTRVVLTIRRLGVPDDLKISIKRAHIAITNVTGHLMSGPYEDIGYIKMTGFVRSSADKFDEMLEELRGKTRSGKLRALVFDLRNDTGGLLSQGIAVADRFLPMGQAIVSVRNKSGALGLGSRDEVYRSTALQTVHCPVVVLVNDGTASAAEIVASALQENSRAIVIGDRTFGKASVQTLYPPPGQTGYYIKLTVARYYSPTGRTIQLTGVMPDVLVPPKVGGKMPLGFREENLPNPLSEQNSHYRSPWEDVRAKLDACVTDKGRAEKLYEKDPNPAIKFDYQLMKGGDYLNCLVAGAVAPPSPGAARSN